MHLLAEDVPCAYWTATALGKWGKANGIAKTLKNLPTVKAYITKVEELDPTFFHYGPARYWGAYYSALPSFAGQDFTKSGEYFEAAIQGAPYYLPTRVLRAELLAVGTQDLALFDKEILTVVRADPAAKPEAEITAENLRDQEKARALFARRAELFDKKALDAFPAPVLPDRAAATSAIVPLAPPAPAPEATPAPVSEPAPASAPAPAPESAPATPPAAPAPAAPAPAAPAPAAPAAPAPAAPAPAPAAPAPK